MGYRHKSTSEDAGTAEPCDCSSNNKDSRRWCNTAYQGTNFKDEQRYKKDPLDAVKRIEFAKKQLECLYLVRE